MENNKKYYWLKLKEDFFDEKQIKYLRRLPDGDKLTITYLKMLLKSIRTEGFIKYDQILPNNEEELAMILDEDINIVKLTIRALVQTKAVEILDDGSFYILAIEGMIGKEGASAERVRKFRERQSAKMLQCNTDVTKCNTEIEIEKDIDINIDIDKNKNEAVKEITNCYENNIGLITPASIELLTSYLDSMDYELIIEAIKIASLMNKRNCKYINGILRDWNNKGYKKTTDLPRDKKPNKQNKNYKQREYDNLDYLYANMGGNENE